MISEGEKEVIQQSEGLQIGKANKGTFTNTSTDQTF